MIITTRLVTHGGERGILGIVTDITERKRSERLLHGLNAAALALEKAASPRDLFPALGDALRRIGLATMVMRGPAAEDRRGSRTRTSRPTGADREVEELCRLATATRDTLFSRGERGRHDRRTARARGRGAGAARRAGGGARR